MRDLDLLDLLPFVLLIQTGWSAVEALIRFIIWRQKVARVRASATPVHVPAAPQWPFKFPGLKGASPAMILVLLTGYLILNTAALWVERRKTQEFQTTTAALRQSRAVIPTISATLYDEFHRVFDNTKRPIPKQKFEDAAALIRAIELFDKYNGTAWYFKGELARAEYDCLHAQEWFTTYMDFASARKLTTGPDSTREVCYQQDGYCRQRNGFVEHLLAVNYYARARKAESTSEGEGWLNEAKAHLERSKQWYPDGFIPVISTRVLEESIKNDLQNARALHYVRQSAHMTDPC